MASLDRFHSERDNLRLHLRFIHRANFRRLGFVFRSATSSKAGGSSGFTSKPPELTAPVMVKLCESPSKAVGLPSISKPRRD